MDQKIIFFKELSELFTNHGHSLYMVGGSVRDYLLGLSLSDMDLVTNATPKQEKEFLTNADYTFEKYGSIRVHYKGVKFDITTLRKESKYLDSRHPGEVIFTDKLEDDVKRRDLTINALYLSSDLKVIDFVGGQNDLSKKIIKMIGEPNRRLEEDPLRIVRIYRFALDLGFEIDSELLIAIKNNKNLLSKIRIEKIKEEIHKSHHPQELVTTLNKLGVNIL